MTSRTIVLPKSPGWAVAAPNTGPGFVSTAFRVPAFQAEATTCWQDFLGALGGPKESGEDFDLDATSLRLPTLKEAASQYIQEQLQAKGLTVGEQGGGADEPSSCQPAQPGPASQGQSDASQRQASGGDLDSGREGGEKRKGGRLRGGRDAAADSSRQRDSRYGKQRLKPGARLSTLDASAFSFSTGTAGRRRRHPEDQPRRPVRKQGLPAFEGEVSAMEQKMKQDYQASAEVLQSVREALANPLVHMSPMMVRPEDEHSRAPLRREDQPTSGALPAQPLPPEEVILRIDVREYDAVHSILQEFLVPGSQPVSALKGCISCPADRNLAALGMGVSGSFFYVEGVFLVDPQGHDYIGPITAFCRQHGIHPPQPPPAEQAEALPRTHRRRRGKQDDVLDAGEPGRFQEWDMNRTTWGELALKVGPAAGYVFCHQGCCEHLLVVKDVRRIHPDDPQHQAAYPKCIREEAAFRRQCSVCQEAMAQKVTYDDRHAPSCPCFWCDTCYRMMHYGRDGKLLYSHKVFPYHSG